MTITEKLDMYEDKKKFIENLNEVFQMGPHGSSVEGITYEVYTKDYGEGRIDYKEYVIVHFDGGGKSPRLVSGNSNIANFRVIGTMLNGGYYDEIREHSELLENGYTLIIPER